MEEHRIYFSACAAECTLPKVRDLGGFVTHTFTNFSAQLNKAHGLINKQGSTFSEMAAMFRQHLDAYSSICFVSPNLLSLFITERKAGVPRMFIPVSVLLQCTARFRKHPLTTDWIEKIIKATHFFSAIHYRPQNQRIRFTKTLNCETLLTSSKTIGLSIHYAINT